MRVSSREFIVGFLLVLALIVAVASGCQPIQLVPSASTASGDEAVASESTETEVVTDTAIITATMTTNLPAASSDATTETSTVTTTTVVTETSQVTGATEVTNTSAVSETGSEAVEVTPVEASAEDGEEIENTVPADPALLEAGMAVYRAQYCGVCHTLDAAETRGTFGPTHNGLGTIAAQRIQDSTYNGAATTAAEYIHESIVEPQAYIVPGYATTAHRMPSYAHLDDSSLDALVAFLLAQ